MVSPKSLKQPVHNTVTLEVVSEADAFFKLQGPWNKLLEESGINNPFLRHEWLAAWWQAYGWGKSLCVVLFYKEGALIGAAPLMIYPTKLCRIGVEIVGFLSNHWTRMDIILTQDKADCLKALVDLLAATKRLIVLAQIDGESETLTLLREALKAKKSVFFETPKMHATIRLEGTWEEYLRRQSANFRQEFRKKLKRLEKKGPVDFIQIAADNGGLDKLRAVAAKSWQSESSVNIITTPQGENFYRDIARAWKGKELMDVSVLACGGEPVSYMVGLKCGGTYYAFDTAYDQAYHPYSAGTLLHHFLLERLFKEKLARFDFGYVADYKKRWTGQHETMTDITVFPRTMTGLLMSLLKKMKRGA